jgi:uncharacterized protein YbjT (DUF2867 family)
MYTVLGASGHIGSVITRSLLDKGEKVRVVGRHPGKLRQFVQAGAEAIIADIKDTDAIAKALSGARAAFLMVPENLASTDYRVEQESLGRAVADAAKNSGLHYAVNLSSVGAQTSAGAGPITGLHFVEKKLNGNDKLNVLHLRCGYFFENHLRFIGMIQMMGILGGALAPDVKFPQIATQDIGAYAADRLLKLDFSGKQTQELLGERDLSMTDVAAIMSKVLNRNDLRYVHFPYDQVEQAFIQLGSAPKTAAYFVEMFQSFNAGKVTNLEPRSPSNTTATSIESFAKDVFLPVFQQQKAASA